MCSDVGALISVRKFPQVIEDILEWRNSTLNWQLGDPTEVGWYLVTVLCNVTCPQPTTDVLWFQNQPKVGKRKWTFTNEKGKFVPFDGQVLTWMKKPEPYRG